MQYTKWRPAVCDKINSGDTSVYTLLVFYNAKFDFIYYIHTTIIYHHHLAHELFHESKQLLRLWLFPDINFIMQNQ